MNTMKQRLNIAHNSAYDYPVWEKGNFILSDTNSSFYDIAKLLKQSIENVKKYNPDLYNSVINGPKPLSQISLSGPDPKRLGQCFVNKDEKSLKIFFEPTQLSSILEIRDNNKQPLLKSNKDKISFLTYLVAHEMEHARQEQKGQVLPIQEKNESNHTNETEIAIEADATAIGISTAIKSGITQQTQKALEQWFLPIIPNLKAYLTSKENISIIEEKIFKEDIEHRTAYFEKMGKKIEPFSKVSKNVVQHPNILNKKRNSPQIPSIQAER